jgi:hypothetical protein
MSRNQSSLSKNNTLTSEDLKTDAVPDTSSERDGDETNNESLSFPPKEEVTGEEEKETDVAGNRETYLRPQSHVSYGTKKKTSPKSTPKSPKDKKEKKKPSGVYLTNSVLTH